MRRLTYLMLAALLGTAACGQSAAPAASAPADWREISSVPLSPREGALGLWTGAEVLLFGGSDARPCPPGADCVTPEESPLRDGAAYHPGTGTWRALAEAPVGIGYADAALIKGTAYLWVPGDATRKGSPAAFLAYDVERDEWRKLTPPPGDGYRVAAVGDRLAFYPGSDETGEKPDQVYDPATDSWSRLPDDPLSPSFDRFMVSHGDELVLFERELVPNPGAGKPAVTRAAVLDVRAGTWRRLPDSELIGAEPWIPAGDRLVNPTLGGADGGGDWGRTVPYGGILDPAKGAWSALPDSPSAETDSGGLLTATAGHFVGYTGWVLDTTTDTWLRIPTLDPADSQVQGRTVVSAGTELFVFGGAHFTEAHPNGALLKTAHRWSPRG